MAWVTAENQKLAYQRQHQKELRADTYKNIREVLEARQLEVAPVTDAMHEDDHRPTRIGKKILSSSFVGSPRWYNAQFQDGMAICREYHKPKLKRPSVLSCHPIQILLRPQQQGSSWRGSTRRKVSGNISLAGRRTLPRRNGPRPTEVWM